MNLLEKREAIDILYGAPLSSLSDCIRGFLIPSPDCELIACDFSNIEGRVLAWLAGEEWKVKAFEDFDKGIGEDLYKLSAVRIFNCPLSEVDFWKRLIGKVAELALGYQGGKRAFQQMAKGYLVKISDEKADEIKNAWRMAHPRTVAFWNELERVSRSATTNHGQTHYAGTKGREVIYKVAGSFLWCKLPSGRPICYPYPEIHPKKTPWGVDKDCLTYKAENSLTHQWERVTSYGGLLAENITQAVARDILADAIKRMEKNGFQVVMHVHDEIVIEVPVHYNVSIEHIEKLMCETPSWAKGLPIVAEGWKATRYRK